MCCLWSEYLFSPMLSALISKLKLHDEKNVPSITLLVINKCHSRALIWESLILLTGSGEIDLDALLEDLCIMEKDMNSGSETDSVLSDTICSPNSPISPKMKVCCSFHFYSGQTLLWWLHSVYEIQLTVHLKSCLYNIISG